jgi:hypothetical protein
VTVSDGTGLIFSTASEFQNNISNAPTSPAQNQRYRMANKKSPQSAVDKWKPIRFCTFAMNCPLDFRAVGEISKLFPFSLALQ